MNRPLFSVVIPAFKQAEFLGETIQSVLNQTYNNFELLIVNDASPDHTEQVVKQFNDPRVKYLFHQQNLGLPAARNTGIRASTGEIIALLDADDIFHRDKLSAHANFLEKHPEIGVSYNARFNLNHSATTIRDIWWPPLQVTLRDFVLGFPFSPSDMVIRRTQALDAGLFDVKYRNGGEDVDFPCRLALAGCQFASVDRVLNYRRYHSGRIKRNLSGRIGDYTRALEDTFADPRCPEKVIALQKEAFTNHYLEVVFYAFSQEETLFGQEIVNKVMSINPDVVNGFPCKLVNEILHMSIVDEKRSHEALLSQIYNQLPPALIGLSDQFQWAVSYGYLLRGLNAIIWDRFDDGQAHFSRARELGAKIDKPFLKLMVYELLSYEKEFGDNSSRGIITKLISCIHMIDERLSKGHLIGELSISKAFANYEKKEFSKVPKKVIQGIAYDHTYLYNRGVLSILLKSYLYHGRKSQSKNEFNIVCRL